MTTRADGELSSDNQIQPSPPILYDRVGAAPPNTPNNPSISQDAASDVKQRRRGNTTENVRSLLRTLSHV